jgi:hypothetical protein
MTRNELRTLLDAQLDYEFVDRQILRRRPWIFEVDETYDAWRGLVAAALQVGSDAIRIVGSAATGFSLSPLKPGRPFRTVRSYGAPPSDIDVALIDPDLFSLAWNAVVVLDRARGLGGTDDSRNKIRVDVYWGLVAQANVPPNTNPARRLLTGMAVAGRSPPLRGHRVRCRVYRRIEDLRAYHVASLRLLRLELSDAQGGP